MSKQGYYGYPNVRDPRDFSPDAESCSAEELAAHKQACATFGTDAYQPNKGCVTEVDNDGRLVKHILRTSWGIGVNMISVCDRCDEMGVDVIACHECGGHLEFCATCWPQHECNRDSVTP